MPDSLGERLRAAAALSQWPVESSLGHALQIVRGRYDFAADGGAQGTIAITSGTPITAGSIIVGGTINVLTALVGPTATIACQVEAANDVLSAVAVATWDVTPVLKNVLAAPTAGALTDSTGIKTSVARNISIVIATADLTAGKFDVYLYVIPAAA